MAYPRSSVREYQSVEDFEANQEQPHYSDIRRSKRRTTPVVGAWYARILLTSLALMPFMFGAVHDGVQLTIQALFFCFAALMIHKHWAVFSELYGAQSSSFRSRRVFILLASLCAYVALQPIALGILRKPHPIIGSLPWYNNPQAFLATFRPYILFLVLFAVTQALCRLDRRFFYKATRFIANIAGLTALVALSHWLYDNGRLFWIFEPEHLVANDRARWPFVSPNSLGQFLVLSGFPLLGIIGYNFSSVIERAQRLVEQRKDALTAFLAHRRQRQLIGLGFDGVLLLSILLALASSLSRGSWFGASAAILALLTMRRLTRASSNNKSSTRPKRARRGSAATIFDRLLTKLVALGIGRFVNVLGLVAILIGVVFFLNEQGREIVSERVEYGLKHSKDDLRWQFYSDSLTLLSKSPLLGIGAGNFAKRFPEVASPVVGEFNLGYLHSDPLQSLIELGMFGGLFEVGIALVLILATLRLVMLSQVQGFDYIFLGLFCGLFALAVSSTVDFPFRVPAIAAYFAVCLGLACYYADQRSEYLLDLRGSQENS